MGFERSQMAKVATHWQSSVVDFTKRNNLLFFKSRTTTLNLVDAPKTEITQLLGGLAVSLKSLVPTAKYEEAQKTASKLLSKQKYLLEELGVSPLFVAIGFCSWEESAVSGNTPEERTTYAPVFLLQIEIENKRSSTEPWKLRPSQEVKLNGVLLHAAAASGIEFDDEEFLERIPEDVTLDGLLELLPDLEYELSELQNFKVSPDIHLAAFGYQDEAIYRDLGDVDALMDSEVVRALAGDGKAISSLQKDPGIRIDSPDFVDPENENLILDADSSQIEAINTALAGSTVVVEGPPGTGKSQTIANMLAEALANNKKVLFVAQKRAAITAVLHRLEAKGLDSLVLDIHEANRGAQVAAQIASSYENMRRAQPVDLERNHEDLLDARSQLVLLKESFFAQPRGLGMNLDELRSLHYDTEDELRPEWRLPVEILSELDKDSFKNAQQLVSKIAASGGFHSNFNLKSENWNVEELRTRDDIVRISEYAKTFTTEYLPVLLKLMGGSSQLSSSVATFYSSTVTQVSLGWLAEFAPKLLKKPMSVDELDDLIASLSDTPERSLSWGAKLQGKFKVSLLVSGDQQAKLQALQTLRRLHVEGLNVESVEQREAPSGWADLLERLNYLKFLMDRTQGLDFAKLPVKDFSAHVTRLAKDPSQFRISDYWDAVASLEELGLDSTLLHLCSEDRADGLSPSEFVQIFNAAATMTLIEEALLHDENLQGLDADSLNRITREFKRADNAHLKQNSKKILRQAAVNFKSAVDAFQAENTFLEGESKKKRAHKSMRTLLQKAPNLMVAANPIWAMSPIQVASYLPRRKMFDLVIFDEASQIKPEMAIPAIMRGATVVVAGDSNQLPPTNFFSGAGLSSIDEEINEELEEVFENTTKDSESILEAMERVIGSRKKRLLWHYRSRDERLIALSNIEIYGNSLTTFPASDTPDALTHVLVPAGKNKAVASGSQNNEAVLVIELIKDHIKKHPNESLGVITFGIKHLEKLEMALAQARRDDKKLDTWIDSQDEEPFFMKNLERVQGDERDAIIISTGYGKDANGKMNLRWGPLTSELGRRRLNVAISRSKRRMTLVTNFMLSELSDLKVREGTGVELFKKFFDYMTNDGESYQNTSTLIELNGFELDIKRKLEKAGLSLVPQFGVCNYRIDFAVRHPKKPDEFVLAIEADGASYHSGHIARERDRLRQMLLEDRGWNFHRIWSTDWFTNPDREVEKVVAAYKEAISTPSKTAPSKAVDFDDVEEPEDDEEPERWLPHPGYGYGQPIDELHYSTIDNVIEYIQSDDLLRSNEEVMKEAREILGYARDGVRIRRYLLDSISRVQRLKGK